VKYPLNDFGECPPGRINDLNFRLWVNAHEDRALNWLETQTADAVRCLLEQTVAKVRGEPAPEIQRPE